MHQNMKNFYELLDIKKNINIFLSISPIIDVNPPRLKIDINKECLYDDILEKKINFNYKIDLLEKIDIKIKLYNKNWEAFNELIQGFGNCNTVNRAEPFKPSGERLGIDPNPSQVNEAGDGSLQGQGRASTDGNRQANQEAGRKR